MPCLLYGIGNSIFLNLCLYLNKNNLLLIISKNKFYGLITLTTFLPFLYKFNQDIKVENSLLSLHIANN